MTKILAVLFLLTLVSLTNAEACEPLPEKAENFIKSFTDDARGTEYCRFRKIARGDINADGVEDLVVVFNIEGACGNDKTATSGTCGNHHETYLKVFLGKDLKEVPVLMIGRRGQRFINELNVVNGVIQAEIQTYGKNDPMCCPSIKGQTTFIFDKESLAEKRP